MFLSLLRCCFISCIPFIYYWFRSFFLPAFRAFVLSLSLCFFRVIMSALYYSCLYCRTPFLFSVHVSFFSSFLPCFMLLLSFLPCACLPACLPVCHNFFVAFTFSIPLFSLLMWGYFSASLSTCGVGYLSIPFVIFRCMCVCACRSLLPFFRSIFLPFLALLHSLCLVMSSFIPSDT